ncbi:carboxypeptidase-like regulatory domain-containing protein [Lacihabitans sp. LS3-19]|uniref:TonB-dependent receptor n=1 Tax=Lacihabitans sp. LS3-19 TaxID=2487335 RepID=UPI0020CE869C|nr:carboxypeptidase-like regulatory domain-containing protein [Lacihabitans sp. LS3-19]MCP9769648.1 carboxypeptidase-like regulatory domain-containing protein [Lacihabitans sp. LS3-19]
MSRLKQHTKNLKLITIFLLFFTQLVFGQKSIKGKIIDHETKEPLAYGTVIINNTTKATTSDETGNFTINDIGLEKFEVVVRYVGYESFTKEINLLGQTNVDITIELKLVPNLMGDFEVKSKKDKNWQKQYQQFQKLFFGSSEFAQKCRIENPYEIDFVKTENGLKATSKVPLIITNDALGYKLILDLKEFHSDGTDYRIVSNIFFIEQTPTDIKQKQSWETSREKAFKYSSKFIFQSILQKNGNQEFYIPKKNSNAVRGNYFYSELDKSIVKLKIEEIKIDTLTNGTFKISIPKNLEIHAKNKKPYNNPYSDISHSVSWIQAENDFILTDKDGNALNPYDIFPAGDLNFLKISGILPLDFRSKEQPIISTIKNEEVVSSNSIETSERILIHANKSRFYAGETIWFKIYQEYKTPSERKSGVVYIDLFNEKGELRNSKIFRSENGISWGEFNLSDTLQAGKYALRAYTNQMRSSGKSSIAEIEILNKNESFTKNVESISDESLSILELEKSIFKNGENLTFDINGQPNESYSISVVKKEYSSKSFFENETIMQHGTKENIFPVEIAGRAFIGKTPKKPEATVWNFGANYSNVEFLESDKNEKFLLQNIFQSDSISLSLKGYDKKNKPLRDLELTDFGRPKFDYIFSKSTKNITEYQETGIKNSPKSYDFDLDKMIVLDEVEVKAKKTENPQLLKERKLFGNPSKSFNPDEIVKTSAPNVLMTLTSLLPNLKTVYDVEKHTLDIRWNRPGLLTPQRPSIIVDGLEIQSPSDIQHLTSSAIAKIDIYQNPVTTVQGAQSLIVIYTKTYLNEPSKAITKKKDTDVKTFKFLGFSYPKSFYLPTKNKDGHRIGQIEQRSTIYWNPNIQNDESGKSYISFEVLAMPGEYIIELAGKDENGKVISERKVIEIR